MMRGSHSEASPAPPPLDQGLQQGYTQRRPLHRLSACTHLIQQHCLKLPLLPATHSELDLGVWPIMAYELHTLGSHL